MNTDSLSEDSGQRYGETLKADEDKYLGVKTGIVKSFGEYKRPGFGHLLDSHNNEYFVHYTEIKMPGFKNLAKGQHVKFRAFEGDKGLYAKEVTVISG